MTNHSPGAVFWAVDLHTHTAGSGDCRDEDFGTPEDFVTAAVSAGLSAVAITDHNRADWCQRIADAAKGSGLVVLPGVELSTQDGHLLGVWEEGTPASHIEDVLIQAGVQRKDFGDLSVVAREGMATCARLIAESGGISIAAHIDKERGILKLPVATHVNDLLACQDLGALEFVFADTVDAVRAKLKNDHVTAMVQGSDCWNVEKSRHCISGIGARRTWIKASRPDLRGLRHAFDDPDLRVTLVDPSMRESHPTITSVRISAGFLGGTRIELSRDLNCLLGGTGAGKSLVLEAIRFALHQQVDADVFAQVRDEVQRRLEFALNDGAEITVDAQVGSDVFRFVRMFTRDPSPAAAHQRVGEEWIEVDLDPADVIPIAAFSQGEILEYARQPVGRVGLVDAHLDVSAIESRIGRFESDLRANATRLIAARADVNDLMLESAKSSDLRDQV
jgi:hypothetical protein